MLDSRNQCLQLVPYLKWGLMHKLVCRLPFDQDGLSCWEVEEIKQVFYYYISEMETRNRKVAERNWVTSVLDSPFIPLQNLSEVSALSIGPLKIEAKGTISLALYTEDGTLRTQPAVPHSFSTVLLIWKHITTSAAFQGHKGHHKHKSLPPPIPNLPPSNPI